MRRPSPSDVVIVLASAAIAAALLYSCSWGRELTWTMPTATAKPDGCTGGPEIKSLSGWRVFAQVQSRTWVENRARMESDPAEWSRLWGTVAAEAMPRQVRSASTKHLPNGAAGRRMTVTVPDSIDGMPVLCWFVVAFNDSGWSSCRSNLRVHR